MSINCTNFCLYQIDGICNLKKHGKRKNTDKGNVNSDCVYFQQNG